MVNRSMVLGAALASLMACSAQGGMGGGGGLLPPEDAGGGGGTNCGALCSRAAAANCPRFQAGTCMSQCAMTAAAPVCNSQVNALLRCSAGATFTCDMDGDPTPMGCDAETLAAFACIAGDAGLGDVTVRTD